MERGYTILRDWDYAKEELKRKYEQDLDEINKLFGKMLRRNFLESQKRSDLHNKQ